jgi:hypothetical protein
VEPARWLGYLQQARAPAGPEKRRYLLGSLLTCGVCGRRMESAWSNGKPAYRCRHGHASAMPSDPGRPKNACVREDRILPHLPALHLLLTRTEQAGERRRRRTRRGTDVRPAISPEEMIGYLREHQITLTWDQAAGTLRAGTGEAAKDPHQESKLAQGESPLPQGGRTRTPVARRWRQPVPG